MKKNILYHLSLNLFCTKYVTPKGSIRLTNKEYQMMEFLMSNPGHLISSERFFEKIWGYDSEGDSSVVAEHIRRIRTKIAAYTNKSYIETVWGCGYKWIR